MKTISTGWTVAFLALALLGSSLSKVNSQAPSSPPEGDYPHGEFLAECAICHSAEGWLPARISDDFDHGKVSSFPLQYSHIQTECASCHTTLDFSTAESNCVDCHTDVHQSELGADCGRCHTSRSFIDPSQMLIAHLATRFPLRGTHRTADCASCHEFGGAGARQWVNTPTECRACHIDEYLATTSPNHTTGGFPQECDQCHSTTSWRPAGFNHNVVPPGTACVDCHLSNYQATADPDHQAAGIPQTCELCHQTNGWRPASDGGNHDALFFPIYSGRHRQEWTACTDCHTVPNSFAQFSCIDCHEHSDQNQVDDDHSEEGGYVYASQACLNCHPRGR